MPDILWWFLIGLLQILSLMLLPAIPVVVWVLWEWYRQETEGLSVADWCAQAACVGDWFLMEAPALVDEAKARCAACPVFAECRAEGDRVEGTYPAYYLNPGVWAGETGLERANRRRRQRQTPGEFLIRLLAEWKTGAPRPARCVACREPVSPSDEPAHEGAVRYGGRGMCSRCYQKAKDQRRKTRAHS